MIDDRAVFVTGAFTTIAAFEEALAALVHADIDPNDISILGRHDEVKHNFGGAVPDARTLQESPSTPRAPYQLHEAVRDAIHIMSESIAALGLVVLAGASYAVGGPVGIAAQTGDRTEIELEAFLDEFVDAADRANYRQNLKDGGLICWVSCTDDASADRAAALLEGAGGRQVHRVSSPGTPV